MRMLFYWLLALAWVVMPSADAADWWRFRGPDCNGISEETDWTHDWSDGGPPLLWRREVGTGFSGVVTSEGRLYTMGNEDNIDTVHCLDAQTGETIWKHSYPSPTDPNEFEGGPTATPTVDGDRVFTLSRRGDLFAFNKVTGSVLWSKNVAEETGVRFPAWGFSGAPLVVGDVLLLNVGDAGTAVRKADGKILWASSDKDAGYSTAVPVMREGKACAILGSARSYVCVEVATGNELWRQRWLTTFGCNAADAIVSGDQVFLSSAYNRGSALIEPWGEQPETVWKHKEFQNQLASSVLIDGYLYGPSGDVDAGTALTCMKWSDGEIAWSEPSIRAGGLIAAGDRLIVLTDSGELVVVAADPASCRPLARHQVLQGKCWTAPVLSGGLVYCRSAAGELVAVDLRP